MHLETSNSPIINHLGIVAGASRHVRKSPTPSGLDGVNPLSGLDGVLPSIGTGRGYPLSGLDGVPPYPEDRAAERALAT